MTRPLSTVAQCAAFIRLELKSKFPDIKFRVQSESYSGGDSVRVSYNNGVPTKEIEAVVNKYQYGHFDGMNDIYEYSNSNDDIPQTKYLFVNREVSEENKEKIKQQLMQDWGFSDFENETVMAKCNCWASDLLYRTYKDLTFNN